MNHKNKLFFLLNLECLLTVVAGLRNNLKIAGNLCTWPPLAVQTEEKKRMSATVGLVWVWTRHGDWCSHLALGMTPHFKFLVKVMLVVHLLYGYVEFGLQGHHSRTLLYSWALLPGNTKASRNGDDQMDIYWSCKTATEYSGLLSSNKFKHFLTLLGTGVTEGTHVAMGFARVCKHKSIVTFVILMPYVRHFTLILMA